MSSTPQVQVITSYQSLTVSTGTYYFADDVHTKTITVTIPLAGLKQYCHFLHTIFKL